MNSTQTLYKKAKKLIPGGTQLLSKRPEMSLPDLWPAYYKKAKGCEIWDLDGRKYVDMSYMGIGSCILGYADAYVDGAVKGAIRGASMTSLNCPEEAELAELLCGIHPWAEMARFARTGGEAMAAAVRIARAKTGKDIILFCGYHGWHDWYISSNLADDKSLDGHLLPGLNPQGVPRGLKGTAIPFDYNDVDGFLKLINANKSKIAAVVMEPIRSQSPKKAFLETIRKITGKLNILLIFDEITSGWRLYKGGAHLKFKVYPDMCVFAKGMSNGYPMAAIIGTKNVMNAAQDTFISSTYWTERIGPAAALATIKKLERNKVPAYLSKIGRTVHNGWAKSAKRHRLNVKISGIYPLGHFSFEYGNSLILKTLFSQFMLDKGFLATTSFYASYAHSERHVDKYLSALNEVFNRISGIIKEGSAEKYLKGPVCHTGFKRLA